MGTQAVDESLGKKVREGKGLSGGVLRLVYLCAFIVPLGQSLASALGGALPPFIPIEVSFAVYLRWLLTVSDLGFHFLTA